MTNDDPGVCSALPSLDSGLSALDSPRWEIAGTSAPILPYRPPRSRCQPLFRRVVYRERSRRQAAGGGQVSMGSKTLQEADPFILHHSSFLIPSPLPRERLA